jgi:hypothetical protein
MTTVCLLKDRSQQMQQCPAEDPATLRLPAALDELALAI